jgi:peptidoglycan/LPS O-acetylase OafA/YrhL
VKQERIQGLQSLRAILALLVASGHSFLILSFAPNPAASLDAWLRFHCFAILQPGNAVMVFYVLSGFVLSTYFRAAGMNSFLSYATFVVRRLARLWPVAAFSVLVGIGYVLIVPGHRLDFASSWFNLQLFPKPFDQASLIRNFLIYDWDFNGVLWSIWVEIAAAFTLPVLVFAKDRFGPAPKIIIGVILAVVMSDSQTPWMFRYMFCFYLGLYVHHAIAWISRSHLVAAIVVLIAAQEFALRGFMTASKNEIVAAIGGFVLVSYCAKPGVVRSRILESIGGLSYSFYAMHLLVMHFIAVFFLRDILAVVGSQFVAQAVVAMSSIALALLVAVPVNLAVERPSIRLASRLGVVVQGMRTKPGQF